MEPDATTPADIDLPDLDSATFWEDELLPDEVDDELVLDEAQLEMEPEGSDTDDPIEDPDIVFTDDEGNPIARAEMQQDKYLPEDGALRHKGDL